MRKLIYSVVALASLLTNSYAQTITTQTFGTGANAFTMDFVEIGNPNNAADTTGKPNPAGSVSYVYNLGKYEISRDMINKANLAGELGIVMADMGIYGGNGLNKPASGISWFEAASFVNYLNTSVGSSPAYKVNSRGNWQLWLPTDAGYNANNLWRNSLAKFFLPSTDEWYKAAFGSPSGAWYDYATGSDAEPNGVASGINAGSAVFNQSNSSGPADITNAGGLSPWGTMAQNGNVWEMLESAADGTNDTLGDQRAVRGGSWQLSTGYSSYYLNSSSPDAQDPWTDSVLIGFRIAMVPEPSAISLLALGGLALVLNKRRRA
jgi:hypothetical protein